MFFGPHFDPHRCKVQLKLAVSRIQIQKTKKANLVKDEKRHIAELLRNRNEESARIRVETVIRDENLIECFNIIEVLCELVFARLGLISASSSMPDELREAIYTLIYASQRVQIPELELIKKQLCAKYGKGLESEVNCQCSTHVNPKIVYKLSYATPEPFLIFQHLNDIACEFHVDWSVDPIVSPISPTYIASPQTAVPLVLPQPPSLTVNPVSAAPPPFPTLSPPQHYQPPPPPYTATPQFPQPPTSSSSLAPPPSAQINRTTSQPQFPSAPQYGSSHLSISASSSSPTFVSNQNNNQNFNIMNLPSPPTTSFPSPPSPHNPTNNINSNHQQQYPDFDDLTARFDALRRQNQNDNY